MFPGLQLLSFIVLVVAVSLGIFTFLSPNPRLCNTKSQLKYWLIDSTKSNQSQSLPAVKNVLNYLGQKVVNGSNEEWDVMWSVDFPFEMFPQKLVGLKPHQLLNHFPAITFLTNKM